MKRQCVCLPNYVIGERAYFKAASVVKRFGHRTVIIGGIKAMKAGAEKLASALLEQGVELLGTVHYGGGLATYENARMLIRNELVQGADSILAMGGEFAIALLLEVCHHIGHHSHGVHNGDWENNMDWCYWDYPLIELDGKTIGIIGFGRIGQTTGKIAKAMGMKVLAYDAFQSESGKAIAEYVELDTLLAQSDVIALHCPLFPSTEGIINKDSIAKMKDGVILINNSRGPLVVEQDLADALNSGRVAAAGLDVVSTEPIRGDNPLLKAKNCIITPTSAGQPRRAASALWTARWTM